MDNVDKMLQENRPLDAIAFMQRQLLDAKMMVDNLREERDWLAKQCEHMDDMLARVKGQQFVVPASQWLLWASERKQKIVLPQ